MDKTFPTGGKSTRVYASLFQQFQHCIKPYSEYSDNQLINSSLRIKTPEVWFPMDLCFVAGWMLQLFLSFLFVLEGCSDGHSQHGIARCGFSLYPQVTAGVSSSSRQRFSQNSWDLIISEASISVKSESKIRKPERTTTRFLLHRDFLFHSQVKMLMFWTQTPRHHQIHAAAPLIDPLESQGC